MSLAQRKDETHLQWRSRIDRAKAIGEGRDVINQFREQHNDFDREFVQHHETGTKTQLRKVKCRITELKNASKITEDAYKALIRYRQAWDICDRSPTRSCIDFSVKGDGDGMLAYLDSKNLLAGWQKAIGGKCKLTIFEAITCKGKSFRQAAIEIYGYANQRTIDDMKDNFDKGVEACLAVVK